MKHLVKKPHAIFSVENPKGTVLPEVEWVGTKDALAHINSLSEKPNAHQIKGVYDGNENSIFVSNPSKEQLNFIRKIAHAKGQESHIESDGVNHKMYYSHGDNAGKVILGKDTAFHSKAPKNYYSTMPDGTHFTHNFDFSKFHDTKDLMKKSDKIPGGLADKKTNKDFSKEKIAQGRKVEMEHTSDPKIAEEIARDHLTEDLAYYDKLKTIEKKPLAKGLKTKNQQTGYRTDHTKWFSLEGHKQAEEDKGNSFPDISNHPNHEAIWVTHHPKHAKKYGTDIRSVDLSGATKFHTDGDDGYLYIRPKKTPLNKGLKGDWKKEGYKIVYGEPYHNHLGTVHTVHVIPPKTQNFDPLSDDGAAWFQIDELHHPEYGRHLHVSDAQVLPEHRRKGITSAVYQKIENDTGLKIIPFKDEQTEDATKLWSQPNRPFGKSLAKGLKGDWQKEGYTLVHKEIPEFFRGKNTGFVTHHITAISPNGKEAGNYQFSQWPAEDEKSALIDVNSSNTHPDHQRKGLASAAYSFIEKTTGRKIGRQGMQTKAANKLWSQPNRPFGKSLQKASLPSAPKVNLNPEHGKKIADAYHNMKHDPNHPDVKSAYGALINETKKQYQNLLKQGFRFTKVTDPKKYPYKNSKEMHQDIENNKHLYYLPTEDGSFGSETSAPKDHPLLATTQFKSHDGKPMLANCLLRQVHDINGHFHGGKTTFSPKGEHQAYLNHKKMYSEKAQPALANELIMQNSYVNFGPNGEHNRKNPANTIYAPQKVGVVPDWVWKGKWHE